MNFFKNLIKDLVLSAIKLGVNIVIIFLICSEIVMPFFEKKGKEKIEDLENLLKPQIESIENFFNPKTRNYTANLKTKFNELLINIGLKERKENNQQFLYDPEGNIVMTYIVSDDADVRTAEPKDSTSEMSQLEIENYINDILTCEDNNKNQEIYDLIYDLENKPKVDDSTILEPESISKQNKVKTKRLLY